MSGRRRSLLALGLLCSCVFPVFAANSSETVNYSYDARGRLTKVSRSGTVNNGVSACYSYDKADNRSNVTVATSDCSAAATPPSFSIDSVSATEGGSLVFTVTKGGSTSSSYGVNFATANGTAASGSDYNASSGTLTFAAAETAKPITVTTINDTNVESSETVLVNLSGATGGATITTSQGIGTILDNDSYPPPSFSISDASASEGGTLTFTVTKTTPVSGSFSVNFASSNGTAVVTSDYNATSGTLTFAANETTKTVTVTTVNDSVNEPTETMKITLSGASGGATISDTQGTGTITDNDAAPSFAINNVSATEGANLVLTVTKTGLTASSFSLNFATANGSAVSGSDYTPTSGSLTFAAGETTKTVSVATIDDILVEADETVLVNLSGVTGGATIADSQGIGTIVNNDLDDGGGEICYENGVPVVCPWLVAPEPPETE